MFQVIGSRQEPKPSSAESCVCKHCSDCDVLLFVAASAWSPSLRDEHTGADTGVRRCAGCWQFRVVNKHRTRMTNTWSPWKDLMLQDAQVLITAFAYLFQGSFPFCCCLALAWWHLWKRSAKVASTSICQHNVIISKSQAWSKWIQLDLGYYWWCRANSQKCAIL